jgi:Ca-activated chloride channel homolog
MTLLTLLALAFVSSSAQAGPEDEAGEPAPDKTFAPYFYVGGGVGDTERLPLESTSADVHVAGVVAHVRVKQVFKNAAAKPIEAVYVFPASTRAAVHGMRMRIGARVIEARIDRKAKARADYEEAKSDGKRAALLEEQRSNVFTMNVANVMPGDRIEVELDYSELLVPREGAYELVYPTVVGPRYTGGGVDPKKDAWMTTSHLHEGAPPTYAFELTAHVETGIPLAEISSPSHDVAVARPSPSVADVRLLGKDAGNRDFVLRWRLAGDKVQTGVLLSGDTGADGERFFALMMEPPARAEAADVPPRELVFLVDVSGSMFGFPLDTTKALMAKLLPSLRPADSFNVVLFSGAFKIMSPSGSVPATPENVAAALRMLGREQGGGGTELTGGLRAAYGVPRAGDRARTVVVVTDGYVGVEKETFTFIRDRLGEANLFAFGIGSGVNRAVIEGMARAGFGEPFVVLKAEQAAAEAERFRAYVDRPLLTHVDVKFDGFEAYDVAPARLPDLMARRPLVLFGKYRGTAPGKIVVTGTTGRGPFRRVITVDPRAARAENAPLRWLWARKQAEWLEDEQALGASDAVNEPLAQLGLRYSAHARDVVRRHRSRCGQRRGAKRDGEPAAALARGRVGSRRRRQRRHVALVDAARRSRAHGRGRSRRAPRDRVLSLRPRQGPGLRPLRRALADALPRAEGRGRRRVPRSRRRDDARRPHRGHRREVSHRQRRAGLRRRGQARRGRRRAARRGTREAAPGHRRARRRPGHPRRADRHRGRPGVLRQHLAAARPPPPARRRRRRGAQRG